MPFIMLNMLSAKTQLISMIMTFQQFTSSELIKTAVRAMKMTPNGSVESTILSMCYHWFNPLAFVLIACYMLVSMIKMTMAGHELGIDSFVRVGIALVVADILIANDGWMAGQLMSLSSAMIGDTSGQHDGILRFVDLADGEVEQELDNTSSDQDSSSIKENMADKSKTASEAQSDLQNKGVETEDQLGTYGVFQLVLYLMCTFIGYIACQVAKVSLMVVCYAAKAEFIVRLAFAPIAFSGFADMEQKDVAMRYLRKLFGAAFYCVSICLVIWIMTTIQGSTDIATSIAQFGSSESQGLIQLLSSLFARAALPFACVGAVSMAKSVINEAFGG